MGEFPVRAEFARYDARELLKASVDAIVGVSEGAARLGLEPIGVYTIFDLAASSVFGTAAKALAESSAQGVWSQFRSLPADLLDSAYRGDKVTALETKPTKTLRLLNGPQADGLQKYLALSTIRDLALWPPYLVALDILSRAFGGGETPDGAVPAELVPVLTSEPSDKVYYRTIVLDEIDGATVGIGLPDGGVDVTMKSATPQIFTRPAVGAILDFEQSWYPQQLILGQLLHSIGLSAGESTRIAVIDWSRKVTDVGEENITQQEALQNATEHNRSIGEIAEGLAHESQSGWSVMSGAGAVGGLGGGGGIFLGPAAGGDAGGIGAGAGTGGGYSSSKGGREISSEMTQNIADRTAQHAASSRTRRASIVREASQSESEKISTRVVTNYNHMHALTVQYYEVVQLYRVVVALHKARRCLFVPMTMINFNSDTNVMRFLRVIRNATVDAEFRATLDGLQSALHLEMPGIGSVPLEPGYELSAIDFKSPTDYTLLQTLEVDRRSTVATREDLAKSGKVNFSTPIPIADIQNVNFTITSAPTTTGSTARCKVVLRQQGSQRSFDVHVPLRPGAVGYTIFSVPSRPNLSEIGERLMEDQLYYSQQIWMSMHPQTLLMALAQYEYPAGKRIVEYIDSTPVGTAGNYLIFPWRLGENDSGDRDQTEQNEARKWSKWKARHAKDEARREQIAPIGTGGIFAEAVLGRANCAELIDLTRFWNWKDSPPPFTAPEIAAVQAASRKEPLQGTPGHLDSPLIVNAAPTALPDPSGTSAILTALTAGNMFRDMSMASTVGTMLGTILTQSGTAATGAMSNASEIVESVGKNAMDLFGKILPGIAGKAPAAAVAGNLTGIGGMLNAAKELGTAGGAAKTGSDSKGAGAELGRGRETPRSLEERILETLTGIPTGPLEWGPEAGSSVDAPNVLLSGGSRKTALVVLLENSGDLSSVFGDLLDSLDTAVREKIEAAVDYLAEEFEKLHMQFEATQGVVYEEVSVLEDKKATFEIFKETILRAAKSGYQIDVITIGHGTDECIVGYGKENITGEMIRGIAISYGKPLPIRSVYMMNCRSATLNDDWRIAGAAVSGGSIRDNYMPEPMLHYFFENWKQGRPFAECLKIAYEESSKVWGFVYSEFRDGSFKPGKKIEDSRPGFLGEGAVTVHTSLVPA